MSTIKAFGKIKNNQQLRQCDAWGCGHFGASRSGGTRTHKGLDIIVNEGDEILSPISGKISRHPIPYDGDDHYKGIEIRNSKYLIKMFYVNQQLPIGSIVDVGQKIAIAQNISNKYGASMTNHVHLEVYQNGELINPETLYN